MTERYTRTPRLEAAARECAGLNEETFRMIPEWERELWCSRAWAAISTWIEQWLQDVTPPTNTDH